jgi:hypothetical protein
MQAVRLEAERYIQQLMTQAYRFGWLFPRLT